MNKAIEHLQHEYHNLRTGRATPGVSAYHVDRVQHAHHYKLHTFVCVHPHTLVLCTPPHT